MATSRISTRLLAGAMPGLRQGVQSIGTGGAAYDQGFEQSAALQSKLAQALAGTRLANAKADEAEREASYQAPEALRNNAMMANGVPLDAAPDVAAYLQTGKLGAQYDALPPNQAGPALPRPDWEAKLSPLARSLAATQTALALGDKNSANVAKATEIGREMSLGDAILRGTQDPMKVAQSQYALKGSAPFHFSEYGVGNNLTGAVDASGAPAQLFARNRQADITAAEARASASRASAASSYASADNSRASAARTRSETERGMRSGDIVVQQAADGTIMLVNKLNGLARPATSADGAAITGKGAGDKDIPATATAKIIEGRQGLTNIDAAIQAIKETPSALGVTNLIPGAQTAKQMWSSPEEIGTRAKISNIGSLKLHDRSGAAVSASEFPRLAPFIPSTGDTPEAAAQKLQEMKRIAEEELGLYAETYSPTNGFRASTVNRPPAAAGVRKYNPATGKIE